jgi:hypothetical protein
MGNLTCGVGPDFVVTSMIVVLRMAEFMICCKRIDVGRDDLHHAALTFLSTSKYTATFD